MIQDTNLLCTVQSNCLNAASKHHGFVCPKLLSGETLCARVSDASAGKTRILHIHSLKESKATPPSLEKILQPFQNLTLKGLG